MHMKVYIDALDFYLPKLKEVADKLFDELGVMIVDKSRNLEFVAKQYNNEYVMKVEKIVNEWRKEIELEQMEFDSIKNYILESRICAEIDDFEVN